MEKNLFTISSAFIFALSMLVFGYLTIGLLPALIFSTCYVGGFIVWLTTSDTASWEEIKVPYYWTLFLFLIHRGIEEQFFGFFDELEKITGVAMPESITISGALITIFSILWILSPMLVKKGYSIGYYGAWSFFIAMGVTELAHFIIPIFTPEPYGYFPGMASVVFLAPVAWWGMWRLYRATKIRQ
jgi:hypothetical protein